MEGVGVVAGDNQAIYDKICESVVEIVCYKSVPPHDLKCSIPGVITNLGDGYCHIIAYNKGDLSYGKFELIFPDKEKMEISIEALGKSPQPKLVAFYVFYGNRSTPQMKAVDFCKEDVSRHDEVFTVGFDLNLPSCHISPGTVTHKREKYFSHDSPPHSCTSRGDLVFNKGTKIVGISCLNRGVTIALNVKSITEFLSLYYEGMEGKTLVEILQLIDYKAKEKGC